MLITFRRENSIQFIKTERAEDKRYVLYFFVFIPLLGEQNNFTNK